MGALMSEKSGPMSETSALMSGPMTGEIVVVPEQKQGQGRQSEYQPP